MKRIIYTSIALLLSSVSLMAQQDLRTAYFLDGYTYSYKMNPAISPERGFFAMPFLGNLGLGLESNLGVSTFLFPTSNGQLTTFLNNSVSSEEFMKGLRKSNKLNVNLNTDILAFGFRTGKAYHTVNLGLKADSRAMLPKALFSFIKDGGSNGVNSWDISGIGVRTDARMELAYGYSRPILDWIHVGGRVKILMGLAREDVRIDRLNLAMSEDGWKASASGHAELSAPVTVGTVSGSKEIDYSSIDFPEDIQEFLKPSLGFALDLGATFDFLDYFTASIAVNDLGFISWNNTTTAEMPEGTWSFDGFGNVTTDPDSEDTIGDQLGSVGDELLDILKVEKTGEKLKKTHPLAATVHVGFEARMPFYERLSFGFLGTQRIDGKHSWTEGRISANVAPVNFFSAAASFAVSNFGPSVGAVVNLHLPGFGLYVGMDSFLPMMNVSPQYIPVGKLNTNLSFGINFSFGKAVGRYRTPEA